MTARSCCSSPSPHWAILLKSQTGAAKSTHLLLHSLVLVPRLSAHAPDCHFLYIFSRVHALCVSDRMHRIYIRESTTVQQRPKPSWRKDPLRSYSMHNWKLESVPPTRRTDRNLWLGLNPMIACPGSGLHGSSIMLHKHMLFGEGQITRTELPYEVQSR